MESTLYHSPHSLAYPNYGLSDSLLSWILIIIIFSLLKSLNLGLVKLLSVALTDPSDPKFMKIICQMFDIKADNKIDVDEFTVMVNIMMRVV